MDGNSNNKNIKSKVVLINYANHAFKKSQELNTKTAKSIGIFDQIISYSPKEIDADFKSLNKKILKAERGNGYWLWKPYFIKKALEGLNFGEFLFYSDSGSYFTNSFEDVIALSLEANQDVVPFELTHLESVWTKRDAFILMDCDAEEYYDTKQRMATFILFRKSDFSVQFVDEWLQYAQDERILTDLENQCGFENYSGFKQHRWDQSVFSLLTKKYDLIAYRDPSQYGDNFKDAYPNSNYNTFVFSTRKRTYPPHILIRKYLSRKKHFLLNLFSKKNNK